MVEFRAKACHDVDGAEWRYPVLSLEVSHAGGGGGGGTPLSGRRGRTRERGDGSNRPQGVGPTLWENGALSSDC